MLEQVYLAYPIVYYLTIVSFSFLLVSLSLPSIMHVASKFNLFDTNDLHRKEHSAHICRLGGIGMFCGFMITVLLFSVVTKHKEANFILASCVFLFAVGLKDDIYGVSARTKFAMQSLVSGILVIVGDFRLTSLYGVFGIWEVNYLFGALFTFVLIIFINNAFNLIDGIDGLAGTIGAIVCACFGLFFGLSNEMGYAFIALAMLGSILGFLTFNFPPAKIFMGDTGSLIIGLVGVVLAVKFIEVNNLNVHAVPYFYSAPAIAVAVLIVPVFDSLRIFFVRIVTKKSPFQGDRNHIHHRLLDVGLSAKQVLLVMGLFNISMVGLTVMYQALGNFLLIILQIGLCMVFNICLTYVKGRKSTKTYRFVDVFAKDTLKVS